MRRADQRRAAVVALYQHDTGRAIDEVMPEDASNFTRELVDGVLGNQEELDALIARHAQGWTLDRIAPLERAIMRVALLEMLHPDVSPGERLSGVQARPGTAAFFHDGRATASIDDALFAQLFFGIWLDARTSEPRLREQLLGTAP